MSTLLLNTESTYMKLQPFDHIDELNKNTIDVRELYADQLTPSTKEVLDVLHRYSCKYPGVCYLSKNKIADMVGVSRRTVVRACNALENLGIINQHELKRHNGDKRQSSNAIVFVAVEKADDNNNVTPSCHTKEALINTHLNSSTTYVTDAPVKKESRNVVKENKTDNKEFLKDSLPDGWYEQAFAYTSDYNDLYRITGELFKAKVNTSIRIETHVEEFGAVLRSAYGRLKNGRINPAKWYAYLFHAFRRKAHALEQGERVNPILNGIAAMFYA